MTTENVRSTRFVTRKVYGVWVGVSAGANHVRILSSWRVGSEMQSLVPKTACLMSTAAGVHHHSKSEVFGKIID